METHLHLEGSIPPRVLGALASRHGALLPRGWLSWRAPLQRRRGFEPFLEAFVASVRLLRTGRDVEEAATALLEDLAEEGIAWAEIIFSPQSYLRRGLSLGEVVAGLDRARRRAAAAGGPRVLFIADGGRLWGAAWMEELVDQVAAFRRRGIVGIGLGGDERVFPARRFRRAFERARRSGLRTVAHAGEGSSPRAVREVIDHLRPERIGHGIGAAGDPRLMRDLAEAGTVLEVCPTSNLMTGAAKSLEKHPLRRLLDSGVRVTLGSDDRTIFGTTLRGEYRAAVHGCGAPLEAVLGMLSHGVQGSFAPRPLKRRLLREMGAAFGA